MVEYGGILVHHNAIEQSQQQRHRLTYPFDIAWTVDVFQSISNVLSYDITSIMLQNVLYSITNIIQWIFHYSRTIRHLPARFTLIRASPVHFR